MRSSMSTGFIMARDRVRELSLRSMIYHEAGVMPLAPSIRSFNSLFHPLVHHLPNDAPINASRGDHPPETMKHSPYFRECFRLSRKIRKISQVTLFHVTFPKKYFSISHNFWCPFSSSTLNF